MMVYHMPPFSSTLSRPCSSFSNGQLNHDISKSLEHVDQIGYGGHDVVHPIVKHKLLGKLARIKSTLNSKSIK